LAQGDAVRTVPCVCVGVEGDELVLETKREERTGWMLKYPAVNSHREFVNEGSEESRRRILVTAENSVDTSGFNSGVNCATGYTYVWLPRFSGTKGLAGDAGCISRPSRDEVYETNSSGSSNGDGPPFAAGQWNL
jgi:hypothetical protein